MGRRREGDKEFDALNWVQSGFDFSDGNRNAELNVPPRAHDLGERLPLAIMVGAERFELSTPSPPDWCANQAAPRSVLAVIPAGAAREGRGL